MSKDYNELSDEELMLMEDAPSTDEQAPVEEIIEDTSGDENPESGETEETEEVPAEVLEDEGTTPDEPIEEDDLDDDALQSAPAPGSKKEAKAPEEEDGKVEEKPEGTKDPEGTPEGEAKPELKKAEEKPDYENLYKQVMGTFKANGKEFTPSSPEEAVQLMQMGANFTKKMQTLAPNLKLMRMLQNNDLLDESKLSYLIDLEQKKPEAIAKLIADAKIDPLDIDTSDTATEYKPANHSVGDSEMAFHNAVETVLGTPTGQETIKHIHNTWDQASKDAIYAEPEVMQIINDHRSNGLYDVITAEIDRMRTLGQLNNVSHIDAYKIAGDKLHAAGKLAPAGSQTAVPAQQVQTQADPITPAAKPNPQPLESRPARRTTATNGDQVRGVSPPRSTKNAPAPKFDVYNMSDEELMRVQDIKV